ncbi:hypothetical protein FB451DRAFT_1369921 [Mycena latifolia]|nr:hypothetical protein FB451DRAFT_1369921 [Mycena latifolia]
MPSHLTVRILDHEHYKSDRRMQNVIRRKNDCIKLMENLHRLLCAIANLHLNSETGGVLPPSLLQNVGKFTVTLHKIHTFVEAQHDGNKIKPFFRQNEMNKLFKECQAGSQEAIEVFEIESGVTIFDTISEMQSKTDKMHKELLEMISNISDGTASDRSFSTLPTPQDSSNSLSMLPEKPKIFYGRELELADILGTLAEKSARIAILGAGGMGKTSLAKAVIHSEIAVAYCSRLFVVADSVHSSIELAALIGSHVGLKPSKDLRKPVVQYFSKGTSCILVLDNLETSWEPPDSRAGIEEFLSLLTDIPHLALIVTMRGAERPGKVRWSHPLLPPLKPLTHDAARHTFLDIADDPHDVEDINKLLLLTDNMPLAVDLIAHLADYEGCPSAKDLLSLLSILPDGLSDAELLQGEIPIHEVLTCKATLLRPSLAYRDDNRLKSLVPIREYMAHMYPPSGSLVQPLRKYLCDLLKLFSTFNGTLSAVSNIMPNMANIHNVLLLGLDSNAPDIENTILCIIYLNRFTRSIGHGPTSLMKHLPTPLNVINNHQLQVHFLSESLRGWTDGIDADYETILAQAQQHIPDTDDLSLKDHAQEAQRVARLSANFYQEARAIHIKALTLKSSANYRQVLSLCNEGRRILALAGLSGGPIDCALRAVEAQVHQAKSEYREAHTIQSMIAHTSSRSPYDYAYTIMSIAEIEIMAGASESDVQKNLRVAKTMFSAMGSSIGLLGCDQRSADLDLREGRFIPAKKAFIQCLNASWGTQSDAVMYCLERLGDSFRWGASGQVEAFPWTIIYLGFGLRLKDKRAIHIAIRALGDLVYAEGDVVTARSCYLVATEGFTMMDIHRDKADCMLRLGDIAEQHGQLDKALNFWEAAKPLFERSLQKAEISQVDSRLAAARQSEGWNSSGGKTNIVPTFKSWTLQEGPMWGWLPLVPRHPAHLFPEAFVFKSGADIRRERNDSKDVKLPLLEDVIQLDRPTEVTALPVDGIPVGLEFSSPKSISATTHTRNNSPLVEFFSRGKRTFSRQVKPHKYSLGFAQEAARYRRLRVPEIPEWDLAKDHAINFSPWDFDSDINASGRVFETPPTASAAAMASLGDPRRLLLFIGILICPVSDHVCGVRIKTGLPNAASNSKLPSSPPLSSTSGYPMGIAAPFRASGKIAAAYWCARTRGDQLQSLNANPTWKYFARQHNEHHASGCSRRRLNFNCGSNTCGTLWHRAGYWLRGSSPTLDQNVYYTLGINIDVIGEKAMAEADVIWIFGDRQSDGSLYSFLFIANLTAPSGTPAAFGATKIAYHRPERYPVAHIVVTTRGSQAASLRLPRQSMKTKPLDAARFWAEGRRTLGVTIQISFVLTKRIWIVTMRVLLSIYLKALPDGFLWAWLSSLVEENKAMACERAAH